MLSGVEACSPQSEGLQLRSLSEVEGLLKLTVKIFPVISEESAYPLRSA